MTFSDETVMAYADGELDEPTRAAVEAAMRSDAALARRIQQQQALRVRLQEHFNTVLTEPVPARLRDALEANSPRPSAAVVPLRPRASARWSWREWSAMAASLVAGAVIAPFIWHSPGGNAVELRQGRLLAAGTLATALTQQLASEPPATGPVRVGISFASRANGYCRTFVVRQRDSLAGLACREPQGWHLMAVSSVPAAAAPDASYRQAASQTPPAITQAVDELIAGQPLDQTAERAARTHGWQP